MLKIFYGLIASILFLASARAEEQFTDTPPVQNALWVSDSTDFAASSPCAEIEQLRAEREETFWPDDYLRVAAIEHQLGCMDGAGEAGRDSLYIQARYRGYRPRSYSSSRSYSYSRPRTSYSRSSSVSRARSGRATSFRPQRIRPPVRSIKSPTRLSRGGIKAPSRIAKPKAATRRIARPNQRALSRGKAAGRQSIRRSSTPKGINRATRSIRNKGTLRSRSAVRPRAQTSSSTRRFNNRAAQKANRARLTSRNALRNSSRLMRSNRALKSRAAGARINRASLNARKSFKPGVAARTFKGRGGRLKPNGRLLARKGLVGRNGTRANLKHGLGFKQATAKRRATNKANNKPASCSFHGDTLVLTRDGFEPIRDLEVGFDHVWSRDERTGDTDWKRVIGHTADPYDQTVLVGIRNDETGAAQTIRSNRSHPFFVVGEKWVRAESLKVGNSLINSDGDTSAVSFVSIHDQALSAYNITVADYHSYFVKGDEADLNTEAVWVHNVKFCPLPPKLSKKETGTLNAIKSTANKKAPKGVTDKQKRINGVHDRRSVIRMGRSFVGANPRVLTTRSGGKMLLSRDGKRAFRYPEKKKNSNRRASKTGYQANYEYGAVGSNGSFVPTKNVHVDVKLKK